ncbi:hypothetical protein NDU88_005167 [Pleurodeles waltl]|uniref:Uncharacterized protein n=1 Tax=Pleurodeles waltl TaxID=8319 RepID=A0AAV7NN65_PLEWA|nr:hypothetical protein NDU88_005167 [Pleurodeles waltl]
MGAATRPTPAPLPPPTLPHPGGSLGARIGTKYRRKRIAATGKHRADIHSYLRETLPKLTGITFGPPLEFQRVHRLGHKRWDDTNRPHPIIACLLHHVQTRQLLQVARAHSPFRSDDLEVRLTDDFSKETSERRRAFLSLRPRLRQLDVKYRLFELARMWITKNGESRDFHDPEDLQVFLEGLQNQNQSMGTETPIHPDMLGPLPFNSRS